MTSYHKHRVNTALISVLVVVSVLATSSAAASPTSSPSLPPNQKVGGATKPNSQSSHQRQRWWRAQAAGALKVSNGAFTELMYAAAQLVTATASGVDSVHSLLSEKTTVYSEMVHRTLYGGDEAPTASTSTSLSGKRNPHHGIDLDGEGGVFGVLSERLAALRPDSLLHISGATQKASYQKQIDTMSERVAVALAASSQNSFPPLSSSKGTATTATASARRIAAEKQRVSSVTLSHNARQDVSNVGSRVVPPSISKGSDPRGGLSLPTTALLVFDEASVTTPTSGDQQQGQHVPRVSPKVYSGILSGHRRSTSSSPHAASRRGFNEQATTSTGATYTASDYVPITSKGSFCDEGAVAIPGFLLDDPTTFLCSYTGISFVTFTYFFSAREFFDNQSTMFTSDTVRRTCQVKYDRVVCVCAVDATLFYNTDDGKKSSVCVNSPLKCSTDILFPVQTCTPRDPEWEHTASPLLVSEGCLSASRTTTNYTFEYQLSCLFPLATNESSVGYYIPGEQELLAVGRDDVGKYPPVDPSVDVLYVILNATEGASFSSGHLPTYEGVQGAPFPGHDVDMTYNAIRRSNLSFPYIYQTTNSSSNATDAANAAIAPSLSFTALNPILYNTNISLRTPGTDSHITGAYFVDGFYNFNVLSDRSQQFRIYFDDVAAAASGETFAMAAAGDGAVFWQSLIELLNGDRTIHRRFDLTNITDEGGFFAGGRLYGEMGVEGASASGDRAVVVVDITDAPRGNYEEPKRVLSLALVAGSAIIGAILLAGVVYVFKEWRARREVAKNRVQAHLLISNDYH